MIVLCFMAFLVVGGRSAGIVTAQESLTTGESSEEGALDREDAAVPAVKPGTYQDNSSSVKYKPSGSNSTWIKNQPGGDGTYASSKTGSPENSVRLKFTGTNKVSVTLRKSNNAGKAKIIIKQIGGAVAVSQTKDLYKQGAALFDTYTYTNLDPSLVYRVRVKVLGTKNSASSDRWVGFDKFVIFAGTANPTNTPTRIPTATPTEDPDDDGITEAEEAADELVLDAEDAGVAVFEAGQGTTTIQENDKKVKYKGTWSSGKDGSTTYKRANVKKNNARIKFKAKSVKVILRKSPDAGRVRVVLRNLTAKTNTRKRLNLYAAKVAYTTDEIFFDNLDKNATYRVRVYVVGKHNSPSTGNYVGIDKFIFTGNVVFPTAGPTNTPSGPTPTPGDDDELTKFDLPIGDTDSLTINIGGGGGATGTPTPTITPGGPTLTATPTPTGGAAVNPQVRFGIKIQGAEGIPDIKVRLKIVDLVVAAESGAAEGSCQAPGTGEYFYKDIIMSADSNGVYYPKEGTSFKVLYQEIDPVDVPVEQGGWVTLLYASADKSYSLSVKGEKQRSTKMVNKFVLQNNNPAAQNFDWTAEPLAGGDLPDPASNLGQDCIVNAADVSLLKSRMGKTTGEDLIVADLDYNNIVNAADNGIMVVTLSTKPDDE
ncbi:hypothetical protein HY407_01995 [Candidatus Gottesmanbacteria bacterium]|nr:hypothetical protein [Candidatus Gottesmanbacteria bacterium]